MGEGNMIRSAISAKTIERVIELARRIKFFLNVLVSFLIIKLPVYILFISAGTNDHRHGRGAIDLKDRSSILIAATLLYADSRK